MDLHATHVLYCTDLKYQGHAKVLVTQFIFNLCPGINVFYNSNWMFVFLPLMPILLSNRPGIGDL